MPEQTASGVVARCHCYRQGNLYVSFAFDATIPNASDVLDVRKSGTHFAAETVGHDYRRPDSKKKSRLAGSRHAN